VLTKYLETGEDIADKKEMIYALNKFQREWLEDKPMFAKVT
jgi:hypothetical protein